MKKYFQTLFNANIAFFTWQNAMSALFIALLLQLYDIIMSERESPWGIFIFGNRFGFKHKAP